jgi:hypothetical protein
MRDVFEKQRRFFRFPGPGNLFFTLCPARLAELLDISAETSSLMPKNNLTLTTFPQKDFISDR